MPYSWNRRSVKRAPAERLTSTQRWHKLAEARRKKGLTTRGTKPKRHPCVRANFSQIKALERIILLSRIDALAKAIGEAFEQLPPKAKAMMLELSHELAAVRKEL